MDKILLILRREYISRVKKKSFLLVTFLMPVLIVGVYALSFYLSAKDSDQQFLIKVVDESGYVKSNLENKGVAKFEIVEGILDSLKRDVEDGRGFALLYIPKINLYNTDGIELYTWQTPGIELKDDIDDAINDALEATKIENLGLNEVTLDSIKTQINIISKNLSGEASHPWLVSSRANF